MNALLLPRGQNGFNASLRPRRLAGGKYEYALDGSRVKRAGIERLLRRAVATGDLEAIVSVRCVERRWGGGDDVKHMQTSAAFFHLRDGPWAMLLTSDTSCFVYELTRYH